MLARHVDPMDQPEGVSQHYAPVATALGNESLQLAGRASLQNEAGQDANATDESNRLGQNDNAESTSEHIAKADSDISEKKIKDKVLEQSSLENLPQTR